MLEKGEPFYDSVSEGIATNRELMPKHEQDEVRLSSSTKTITFKSFKRMLIRHDVY
jgi:hypothetical protein